ncbi:MAG: antitoxin [Acidimicrobiia bacterium]|nr:antitoxin [Acidimicrobiia bacterium]
MSFLDKAKDALSGAKDKVDDLADEHGDKMKDGIEKAGDFVDEKTGGKYADQVDAVQEKADEVITDLDDTPEAETPEGETPKGETPKGETPKGETPKQQ